MKKVKVTWHTAKYGNPYSEFVLCIYPIQSARAHTHRHTHTRSSGQPFMLRHPGSSWGFGVLLKGTSVVVLRVERALCIHSPTYNSCRTWDSNSQPLGYESDSLTIRPRLPQHCYSPTLVVCIYSITCTACLTSQLCVFLGGRELHSDCLALVQAPTVQVESQLTLPLDINNYTISKFVQIHFKVRHA